MIKGYKAFNSDKTNRYGFPFESGNTYSVDGEIKFGNEGNGYHLCTSISDVFRYVDADSVDNYVIAEVYGFGDYKQFDDDYEGYYDMYSVRHLYIKKFLTRDEVFEIIKKLHEWQIMKIIKTSKLLPNEIEYIKDKYKSNVSIICALLYYQLDQKDIYERYYGSRDIGFIKNELSLRKVKKDGQNNC